jgi:hypothetical protein
MLPFVLVSLLGDPEMALWQKVGRALVYALAFPPVTAYLALNFTGSTPITSKSGVKREMYAYIPIMAWMLGSGIVITLILIVTHILGGAS